MASAVESAESTISIPLSADGPGRRVYPVYRHKPTNRLYALIESRAGKNVMEAVNGEIKYVSDEQLQDREIWSLV